MDTVEKHLFDISSYASTDDSVENFLNHNLQLSIKVVNECLTLDDEYLAKLFMEDQNRAVFLMIAKLALHLLLSIKTLKAFECNHLYNIGLLNIKIMNNKYIYGSTSQNFHVVLIINSVIDKAKYVITKENFYDTFFRYRFKSNNLIECLLEHIQNITDSSLIRIVCLWLDIVVYYQHVNKKRDDDLEYSYFDPRKIVSECIIKQKYNLPNNLRLRGSFLFYLTYIPYPHINDDEKLASICRHHMLSETKDLNKWTSDTIHCAMGTICLMTRHYSKHVENDEKYYRLLVLIVTNEKFQQALASTWTNDETILIHTIIEYFYENLNNNNKMRITLGPAIDKLHTLYESVKYELTKTKMNICYLILASTYEQSNVSDEILLECFQYIETRDEITGDHNIELGGRDKILQGLKAACHYDSIKDAVIRLKKIDELTKLIRTDPDIICDILALLSTESDVQKILQEDMMFIYYMASKKERLENRHSFRILRRNINFTDHPDYQQRFEWPERVVTTKCSLPVYERTIQSDFFVEDKFVLSCSNTQLAKCIKNHLQTVSYNILILNQCNNDMEKEKSIVACKCMIACLTDDYNLYPSELILAYKNQVHIIPIIIENEKEYCPKESFLKFILEKYSLSSIRTNINDLDHSLANEIKRILRRQSYALHYSFNANDISSDPILQPVEDNYTAEDLYRACKENDISKVKQYLRNINIKILNERIKNGSTALHIASYNGHNELVRLLLKAGASRSIRNRDYNLTPYEEARTQSTKDLFRMKMDDDKPDRFVNNNVYIEWMTAYRDPHKKRDYLREKLDQLRTYNDNEVYGVYDELVERMCAYIDTLPLLNNNKQILKQFFSEMKETCDPFCIIKAYTSTAYFHKYYNEYIAQHGIDFFHPLIVDVQMDYSIVKCVMETIAILMYNEKFDKHRYRGKTFRGMIMTEEDLCKYVVNSKIMNKSFLSTSKSQEVAKEFVPDVEDEKLLRKTPDKQPIHISVLCTYIIKDSETALDIESIPEQLLDEEEVLILPYSIFEVKSVQRSSINIVQIELEEVSDELLDNCN